MSSIYLSSTYRDLAKHREAVTRALVKIRYEVRRMEDYPARDEHTKEGCERDVDACDLYVGLFAWRYGFVPEADNPERWSMTEIEYRRARARQKPCLLFLLAEKARWPDAMRDASNGEGEGGGRIAALRAELAGLLVGSFTTPDSLAAEVLAAIHQHESEQRVQRLEVLEEMKQGVDLGPSYLANIQKRIVEARDAEIVELSLGPTPWWTTRLHLVAALASDFTRIRQFVFLDATGSYLTMAPPTEVRRALARREGRLERAYLDCRHGGGPVPGEIDHIATLYRQMIVQAFDGRPEEDVKEDVSSTLLTRDLGIESSADTVEQRGGRRATLQLEILSRAKPYVVLLEQGRVASLVDRARMASRIALAELEGRLR